MSSSSSTTTNTTTSNMVPVVEPKTKQVWLGIKKPKVIHGGHITLIWMGHRSDVELKAIQSDVATFKTLYRICHDEEKNKVVVTMGGFDKFGPNNDIPVRKCSIKWLSDDMKKDFKGMYHRYYYHAPGECEERLKGPNFHITIGKDKITLDQVNALTSFDVDIDDIQLFVKDVAVVPPSPPAKSESSSSMVQATSDNEGSKEKKYPDTMVTIIIGGSSASRQYEVTMNLNQTIGEMRDEIGNIITTNTTTIMMTA